MRIEFSSIHTNDQLNTCVLKPGHVCMNTCKESVAVGDGVTAGGLPILSSRHASAAAMGHFGLGTPTEVIISEQNAWVLLSLYSQGTSCGGSLSPDTDTGLMTAVKAATYMLGFSCSYIGVVSNLYEWAVMNSEGNVIDSIATCGRMNNANDVVSVSSLGLAALVAGQAFGLYVRNTTTTGNISIGSMSFTAVRCSD